jgi:pilus assembly protein Flp/PilA
MKTFLHRLLRDQTGGTAIEYGLICSLIIIAMISAFNGFADTALEMWDTVATAMNEANA